LKVGETPFEAMTYISGNFLGGKGMINVLKHITTYQSKIKGKEWCMQIFYCALLSAVSDRKLSFQPNISIA